MQQILLPQKKAINRNIPSEVIIFEILRFKQAIYLAKVHEDIKDGSKIILCQINKHYFLRGIRKNTEKFMNGFLCYHQWKREILGWYQFRTKWYFEGASRFLRSRMSIAPSLQFEQNGRLQKHSKYYSCEDRIWMGEEPSIEEVKLYKGMYFHR